LTGQGDPAKALAGLHFWTWNTEEVLDMIKWMRKYNEDPMHPQKIKFYGFDMQFPEKAASFAVAYLKGVDSKQAKDIEKQLAIIKNQPRSERFRKLPKEIESALCLHIANILKIFDDNKKEYITNSTNEEYDIARQHLRLLQQYYSGGMRMRDQAMAENVLWIKRHEGFNARMVIWAHNGHVATNTDNTSGIKPMGWYLRQELKNNMVVVGFAFNQGTFQVKDANSMKLQHFNVGSAPVGSLDWTLAKAGLRLAALDLRSLPNNGSVGSWFSKPHATRSIGAIYYAQDAIGHMFDMLRFVETTTAARPVVQIESPKKN
jgi:erythromycin esterase